MELCTDLARFMKTIHVVELEGHKGQKLASVIILR